MAYTTTIYDPKQGLEKISENIEKFSEERFTAAMLYKSWNEIEIEIMAREVSEYRIKLEKEHLRLIEYAKTFNQEFVTDNNQCFNTALKLLRKLRCGISEVKRIYRKFCPRPPRQRCYYTATATRKPSAYDYSYLAIDSGQRVPQPEERCHIQPRDQPTCTTLAPEGSNQRKHNRGSLQGIGRGRRRRRLDRLMVRRKKVGIPSSGYS